nr:unnamed protein product [Spirometra erinaceieuropaei]
MHFQSRVSTTNVQELLFADDCALNTTSEAEMQRSMDLFSAACEKFGLVINTQKTVVMHQPSPNSVTPPPQRAANQRERNPTASGGELPLSPSHPETELDRIADTDVLERTRIVSIYTMLRLLYGDVAAGSRRQGGRIRRYKGTLKSSLKHLQINPTKWEELALDRPTWRRTVKTGAAIYEANRIAAAKAKREARKSQQRQVRNADAQPLPTCPRCQRTFRAPIGLVGHLRINCASRTAPTIVSLPASSSSSLPPNDSDNSSEPSLSPSSSSSSSSTLSTTAAQAGVSHITNPDTTTDTTPTSSDSSDEDQDYTCSHCDRTFTSHIGLVGHLRIHRTETGGPVPGAPTYTHQARLNRPHCPRTFRHRMGLFGHMRIHESGIDRSTDSFLMPNPTTTSPPCAPTALSAADTDATDFICPHCPRAFNSRISLVGHLRIHRTETGEPVPGAPTYTHRTRLYCPHFPRTFKHRMGLFGHMRIHESGIDRNSDTPTTSNTATMPSPILGPSPYAPITTTASSLAETDTADFSCPHCPRTSTSRIGLFGHLRMPRTGTGKPVPGAPTYTHQARLNRPHCPRTFRHRMGLFGHMRIHDDLR